MRLHPGNAGFLLTLSSLSLIATAIALSRHQDVQLTKLSEEEIKGFVLQFERTGCYGSCPAYKLIIYGDGRVEYEGKNDVKQKGREQGRLDTADIKRLLAEIDKTSFFNIGQYTEKDCSCTLCTDMPSAITEIRVKGISHRVEHYYGCTCAPKLLGELEGTIDKLARSQQWTGDVSKQGPVATTCFSR